MFGLPSLLPLLAVAVAIGMGGWQIWKWVNEQRPHVYIPEPRNMEFAANTLKLELGNSAGSAIRYLIVVHAGDGIYFGDRRDLPAKSRVDGYLTRLEECTKIDGPTPLKSTRILLLVLVVRDHFRRWWYRDFASGPPPLEKGKDTPDRRIDAALLQPWLDDQLQQLNIKTRILI